MTPSTWIFEPTGLRRSEIADFEPIFARSDSAVTPSENSSINTNRKSTTRFPVSLWWSSYVAPKPPKGSSKTQNGWFPSKIALSLKKVCYKVSVCENCQRQSCNLPNYPCENDWWGDPSYPKFWVKLPRWSEIADFRSLFTRSVSAVTSNEKSSINTNRKSTTRFQMSPIWTSYVVRMSPWGGSKTQSV